MASTTHQSFRRFWEWLWDKFHSFHPLTVPSCFIPGPSVFAKAAVPFFLLYSRCPRDDLRFVAEFLVTVWRSLSPFSLIFRASYTCSLRSSDIARTSASLLWVSFDLFFHIARYFTYQSSSSFPPMSLMFLSGFGELKRQDLTCLWTSDCHHQYLDHQSTILDGLQPDPLNMRTMTSSTCPSVYE